MTIALDFDGTCVAHEFPQVGRSIGAEPVLTGLIEGGHRLILWTVREGEYLAPRCGGLQSAASRSLA